MSLHRAWIDAQLEGHAARSVPEMIWIPGGTFRMGSDRHYPEEAPAHQATVDGFWIDRTPVTNAQFREFVAATGYVTLAERVLDPEDHPDALAHILKPGSLVFDPADCLVHLRDRSQWWSFKGGANWRQPHGKGSSIRALDDHPVVHVAYGDAQAYAHWVGKDLPTEAEWEFAARGGLESAEFAWGDQFMPGGRHMANTWQGDFPQENRNEDGFERTSPVRAFPPNGYGLYDMIGNVWEWTADEYSPEHTRDAPTTSWMSETPLGGGEKESCDPCEQSIRSPRKVIKGGSYLCAPNHCRRYRPAARHAQPAHTSTSDLGFRCVERPTMSTATGKNVPGTQEERVSLDDFVRAANIARYSRMLEATTDENQRDTILKLLAEEKVKQESQSPVKGREDRTIVGAGPPPLRIG